MGNKTSAEKLRSKKLSMKLEKAKAEDEASLKLLLLGAGESGKSTIFKQMKLLYGQGFTPDDRLKMRPFLIGNVIEGACDILAAADLVGVKIQDPKAKAAADVVLKATDRRAFSEEVAAAINTLWDDEDFRAVWEKRSHYQVQDTWNEFADALRNYPTWGGPSWAPTTDEILRSRVRTTGVVDEQFTVKSIKLRMLDVGGQRNERRKWIHCFQDVTSVLFVASISEYDQMLFEDSSKNRLIESLELFEEHVNGKWFVNSAMILFLNKVDLFKEKYLNQGIPLNVSGLFPSAPSGTPNLQQAQAWFKSMFEGQVKNPGRKVYTHFTCATDTKSIDAVMTASSQHILKQNLTSSGVLV